MSSNKGSIDSSDILVELLKLFKLSGLSKSLSKEGIS